MALLLPTEFLAKDWTEKCNSVHRFHKSLPCTNTDGCPVQSWFHDGAGVSPATGPHQSPPAPPHSEPGPYRLAWPHPHQTSHPATFPRSFPTSSFPLTQGPQGIWRMERDCPGNTAETSQGPVGKRGQSPRLGARETGLPLQPRCRGAPRSTDISLAVLCCQGLLLPWPTFAFHIGSILQMGTLRLTTGRFLLKVTKKVSHRAPPHSGAVPGPPPSPVSLSHSSQKGTSPSHLGPAAGLFHVSGVWQDPALTLVASLAKPGKYRPARLPSRLGPFQKYFPHKLAWGFYGNLHT